MAGQPNCHPLPVYCTLEDILAMYRHVPMICDAVEGQQHTSRQQQHQLPSARGAKALETAPICALEGSMSFSMAIVSIFGYGLPVVNVVGRQSRSPLHHSCSRIAYCNVEVGKPRYIYFFYLQRAKIARNCRRCEERRQRRWDSQGMTGQALQEGIPV
jgi:hypothetical protein